jgi:hypothetical protein|tara:strand:+ start:288 stop:437 length:150 start_codon:yes stop_codon:yes gene_type:complete
MENRRVTKEKRFKEEEYMIRNIYIILFCHILIFMFSGKKTKKKKKDKEK